MKIAELFPIDGQGISWDVFEILTTWLCEEVNQKEHFDSQAGFKSIRIMAAFRALEKDGTAAAFKEALYRSSTDFTKRS